MPLPTEPLVVLAVPARWRTRTRRLVAVALAAALHSAVALWWMAPGTEVRPAEPPPAIEVRLVPPPEPPPPPPRPLVKPPAPPPPPAAPLRERRSGPDLEGIAETPATAPAEGPKQAPPPSPPTETADADQPPPPSAPKPEPATDPGPPPMENTTAMVVPPPAEPPQPRAKPAPPAPSKVRKPPSAPKPSSRPPSEGRGDPYLNAVWEAVERHRVYPSAARPLGLRGTAKYEVVVDRSGQVVRVRLEKTSGADILDRAGEEMIRGASPLPPPPDDVPGKFVHFLAVIAIYPN